MARILGVDIPRNKEMRIALRSLYGVGQKLAKDILSQCNIELSKNSSEITEEEAQLIRSVIEESYTVEGDLRREVGLNVKRLKTWGCYRGHLNTEEVTCAWSRTHTNARTRKGKAVAIAGKKSIKSMK